MSMAQTDRNRDPEMDLADDAVDTIRADYLPGKELDQAVERGDLTATQADDELQGAARRHAAEHGPDLDTDAEGTVTQGGFGSGQGMAHQSTGGRKARGGT